MATESESNPALSLFISYASEDRVAARKLRDAVSAQGIEVWYDEDELTGGDAWDQKIRRRIRACDYFMPLISNATEARREGYFRREWRQAVERTLDMADDVMFLLPVCIDDTPEAGSRVPERFLQVHWTRCPGGESNANLIELCDRMLHGHDAADDHALLASSSKPRPRTVKPKAGKSLPPYPTQPHRKPDEPSWLHAFNLGVWVVRCVYRAYRGFPWFLRWMVIIWAISFLFGRCSSPSVKWEPDEIPQASGGDDSPSDGRSFITRVVENFASDEDKGKLKRLIGAVADAAQSGRSLALVPFAADEAANEAEAQFAETVFTQLVGSLESTRADQLAFSPTTLGTAPEPTAVLTRTARIDSRFLLAGWIETDPATGVNQLVVVIHAAGQLDAVWTERFSLAGGETADVVDAIGAGISEAGVFTSPAEASTPASN